MNSASYEYRNMSTRRNAQFVPIKMQTICWKTFRPTICWKTFRPKTTNKTRNSYLVEHIHFNLNYENVSEKKISLRRTDKSDH